MRGFFGLGDGHLRAYSAAPGAVLWDMDTACDFDTLNGKTAHGGSMDAAGPMVSLAAYRAMYCWQFSVDGK